MQHTRVYRSLTTAGGALFLALCLASYLPLAVLAQSPDETAIRRLTERFFAAYQAKDLDGLMRLWSASSPNLADSKQNFQQSLAAVDKVELANLSIHRLTVDGDKATVRLTVEITAVEAKTGKAAEGFGKLSRTLYYVKEGGEWKLWRYASSEEELAAALAAAKTEEDRKALLASEKELLSIGLQRALITQGNNLLAQGTLTQALSVYQVALGVAEQLDDKK